MFARDARDGCVLRHGLVAASRVNHASISIEEDVSVATIAVVSFRGGTIQNLSASKRRYGRVMWVNVFVAPGGV